MANERALQRAICREVYAGEMPNATSACVPSAESDESPRGCESGLQGAIAASDTVVTSYPRLSSVCALRTVDALIRAYKTFLCAFNKRDLLG